MARKRSEPRVPRSRATRLVTPRPASVEGNVKEEAVPVSTGPRNVTPEEFHAYVKADLTRIGVYSALILGAMIVLKLVMGG
jgi:hypothetical protein